MYKKPMIVETEGMAEGVFAASNATGSGCYTVSAYIHQTPETGRETYVIQVNGKHAADHACDGQVLTISFDRAVTYVSSQGTLLSGNGTNTLVIKYGYHNNASDNIGLGDISVSTGDRSGLNIVSTVLDDTGYQK